MAQRNALPVLFASLNLTLMPELKAMTQALIPHSTVATTLPQNPWIQEVTHFISVAMPALPKLQMAVRAFHPKPWMLAPQMSPTAGLSWPPALNPLPNYLFPSMLTVPTIKMSLKYTTEPIKVFH